MRDVTRRRAIYDCIAENGLMSAKEIADELHISVKFVFQGLHDVREQYGCLVCINEQGSFRSIPRWKVVPGKPGPPESPARRARAAAGEARDKPAIDWWPYHSLASLWPDPVIYRSSK